MTQLYKCNTCHIDAKVCAPRDRDYRERKCNRCRSLKLQCGPSKKFNKKARLTVNTIDAAKDNLVPTPAHTNGGTIQVNGDGEGEGEGEAEQEQHTVHDVAAQIGEPNPSSAGTDQSRTKSESSFVMLTDESTMLNRSELRPNLPVRIPSFTSQEAADMENAFQAVVEQEKKVDTASHHARSMHSRIMAQEASTHLLNLQASLVDYIQTVVQDLGDGTKGMTIAELQSFMTTLREKQDTMKQANSRIQAAMTKVIKYDWRISQAFPGLLDSAMDIESSNENTTINVVSGQASSDISLSRAGEDNLPMRNVAEILETRDNAKRSYSPVARSEGELASREIDNEPHRHGTTLFVDGLVQEDQLHDVDPEQNFEDTMSDVFAIHKTMDRGAIYRLMSLSCAREEPALRCMGFHLYTSSSQVDQSVADAGSKLLSSNALKHEVPEYELRGFSKWLTYSSPWNSNAGFGQERLRVSQRNLSFVVSWYWQSLQDTFLGVPPNARSFFWKANELSMPVRRSDIRKTWLWEPNMPLGEITESEPDSNPGSTQKPNTSTQTGGKTETQSLINHSKSDDKHFYFSWMHYKWPNTGAVEEERANRSDVANADEEEDRAKNYVGPLPHNEAGLMESFLDRQARQRRLSI